MISIRVLVLAGVCLAAATFVGLLPKQHAVRLAHAATCSPARLHASGTSTETLLTVAEGTRTYLLHVPPSYNGSDAVPLIFNFHGLGSNASQQEAYSQFSIRADQPDGGFIVVYPQGIPGGVVTTNHWNAWLLPVPPETDDVAFTLQILDVLESQLCIDATEVFSTGMSNGGIMSTRVACSLSSQFAAVGPVAGWYYPADFTELDGTEVCPDTRPVPIIGFHGTADNTVPYNGGSGGAGGFTVHFRLPLDNNTVDEDVIHSWAVHNNCTSGRVETQIDTNTRLTQYDGCDEGATLQLYSTDGGGHSWPGPFAPGTQVNATNLIWDFFQNYSLDPALLADTDGDSTPDAYDDDDDNDGCPDVREQQTSAGSQLSGGLRSSKNAWDYFNPTGDKQNRIDDVLAVLVHYGLNAGQPGYDTKYDRTHVGPNNWNLGPPNDMIRIDDVLNALYQYAHDCV